MLTTNTSTDTTTNRADANRRIAQHSTGPRTEAGKARSSQNATRSGWFSRDLRVAEDKIELYLEFEEAWTNELEPHGLLELEAFSDFLRAAWHKREVIDAQNELTASSSAAFLDDALAKKLDRLHRYLRDFERRANQALRELRRLQTERAAAEQKQTQPPPPPQLDIPADLRLNLHIMEVETNHWNALLRARKAGLQTGAASSGLS